jgi:hypothetical protein
MFYLYLSYRKLYSTPRLMDVISITFQTVLTWRSEIVLSICLPAVYMYHLFFFCVHLMLPYKQCFCNCHSALGGPRFTLPAYAYSRLLLSMFGNIHPFCVRACARARVCVCMCGWMCVCVSEWVNGREKLHSFLSSPSVISSLHLCSVLQTFGSTFWSFYSTCMDYITPLLPCRMFKRCWSFETKIHCKGLISCIVQYRPAKGVAGWTCFMLRLAC